MNIDYRIESLKKELRALEEKKSRGPLSFTEWLEKEEHYYRDVAITAISTYGLGYFDEATVSYRRGVGREHIFLPGEHPVLMRGSFLAMTQGGDYQSVQRYVSRVLSRYITKVSRPTIFFRKDWGEYWHQLRTRYMFKHGEGNPDMHPRVTRPPRYMGRREPFFMDLSTNDGIGLDAYSPCFMIRGKLFNVRDMPDGSVDRGRVAMLTAFAKQEGRLSALDDRIKRLENRHI